MRIRTLWAAVLAGVLLLPAGCTSQPERETWPPPDRYPSTSHEERSFFERVFSDTDAAGEFAVELLYCFLSIFGEGYRSY